MGGAPVLHRLAAEHSLVKPQTVSNRLGYDAFDMTPFLGRLKGSRKTYGSLMFFAPGAPGRPPGPCVGVSRTSGALPEAPVTHHESNQKESIEQDTVPLLQGYNSASQGSGSLEVAVYARSVR